MLAAEPAPAAPPAAKPAEVVVSVDAHSDILTSLDTPLPLIKGRRTEDAVLRQAISLTSTLTVARPAVGSGEETLRWRYQAYLQRQLCFTSITGQFSCATAEAEELPETVSGEAQLATPPTEPVEVTPGQTVEAAPPPAAPGANPAAEAARLAVTATLRARAPVLFDDDRRRKFSPMLKAAGVRVRAPVATGRS